MSTGTYSICLPAVLTICRKVKASNKSQTTLCNKSELSREKGIVILTPGKGVMAAECELFRQL